MKTSNVNRCILKTCLALLFVSPLSHAEIYKWVDANGRTHYSEKRGDAANGKEVEVKVTSQPTSTSSKNSSAQYWQNKELEFKQRQVQKKMNENSYGPPIATRPKSLSGGRSDNTDASKCNLARDVLNGSLRHSNGAPIDKYDRDVAENDVRTYCR